MLRPPDIISLSPAAAQQLPAARLACDELHRDGHALTRDALAARLRRHRHTIRNASLTPPAQPPATRASASRRSRPRASQPSCLKPVRFNPAKTMPSPVTQPGFPDAPKGGPPARPGLAGAGVSGKLTACLAALRPKVRTDIRRHPVGAPSRPNSGTHSRR